MAINSIATSERNSMCNALVDAIDAGSGDGTIRIYTAASPEVLLSTQNFSDPAFGNAASGVATAGAIDDDSSADATGTAAVLRVYDSDSNLIFRGTVGTSGADLNMNTVSFTAGDVISISSMTITMPAS